MAPKLEINSNTLDHVSDSWPLYELKTHRKLVLVTRDERRDSIYVEVTPCSESSTTCWRSGNMYAISCLCLCTDQLFVSLYDITCLLGFLQRRSSDVFSISKIWPLLKAAEPMPGHDSRFHNWDLSGFALDLQTYRCLPDNHVPMGYDFIPWRDLKVYLEKGFNAYDQLTTCVRSIDPGDLSRREAFVWFTSVSPPSQAQHGEGSDRTMNFVENHQQQVPSHSPDRT
ncbi:hypothetical protein K470DRAFT_266492 [Piedraia hortae CBS 480.64]|uniref:DUF7082 domain-containing protein n=1 Tax=Piedraia hortae CBS 480.64 TaxID=1314780 RepID=A0A6A7BRM8_9PEZI|nr:hypothetical protein K470DRAFT_266492 [Piedraia hortae CBS 480.64]